MSEDYKLGTIYHFVGHTNLMWVKIEAQLLQRFSPFPLSKARMFNFPLLRMTQMFQNQSLPSCQPIFLSFLQDVFHGEISTFHSSFE